VIATTLREQGLLEKKSIGAGKKILKTHGVSWQELDLGTVGEKRDARTWHLDANSSALRYTSEAQEAGSDWRRFHFLSEYFFLQRRIICLRLSVKIDIRSLSTHTGRWIWVFFYTIFARISLLPSKGSTAARVDPWNQKFLLKKPHLSLFVVHAIVRNGLFYQNDGYRPRAHGKAHEHSFGKNGTVLGRFLSCFSLLPEAARKTVVMADTFRDWIAADCLQ